jgi:hypothetical protein
VMSEQVVKVPPVVWWRSPVLVGLSIDETM